MDESNHVSYSFEFFLHGASRVCTSVDIGMHKPIRVINQLDLIKMRACLKKHFLYSSKSSRATNNAGVNKTTRSKKNDAKKANAKVITPKPLLQQKIDTQTSQEATKRLGKSN